MDLHRYELLKSGLANLLRARPWRTEQFERHRDLFAGLAEDRLNVVVVGRFSRGESTLMNAMPGLDRLPTGIEPLTSVIISITYGSHETVVLRCRDTSLFLDIRLDELEEYVTERGNPGNRVASGRPRSSFRRRCCDPASASSTRPGSAPRSPAPGRPRAASCRRPTRSCSSPGSMVRPPATRLTSCASRPRPVGRCSSS